MVQLVDLMPTLLTELQMSDDQAFLREGKSLSFSAWGDEEINTYAYAGSWYKGKSPVFRGMSVAESIRGKKWKLIKEELHTAGAGTQLQYELYDIENDPYELANLYERETEIALKLNAMLKRKSEYHPALFDADVAVE